MKAGREIAAPRAAKEITERVRSVDWGRVAEDLDARGCATTERLLTPAECEALVALYDVEGVFRSRLDLTPGMTGPWQVLGSARIPMEEMVGIDYLYIANWSLWSDIKIMLRTIPHMLSRGGM